MKKEIQLVIFDMAGTTINEDNIVYKTIRSSLASHGIDVTLDEVLVHGGGKEKWNAIHDIISHKTQSTVHEILVDNIYTDFQEKLEKAYFTNEVSTFESVFPLLAILKSENIQVAFNTGYQSTIAIYLLQKVGIEIGRDIDILITADDVDFSRPQPDMILLACDKLGLEASSSIKVGDTGIDILEGINAGTLYNVAITTGAQHRDLLALSNPDFIIDDLMELLPIIGIV
jgi:phosphonatase-like hydrolase